MTEEEIFITALDSARKSNEKIMKFNHEKGDYDFGLHSLYKDTVKMMRDIRNHAVKGIFPRELYEHRSPNQSEKEAIYIEKNHKQITLPTFLEYVNTICRPFGDGNWNIKYSEKEPDKFATAGTTFKEYVETEIPTYGSLEFFIKSIIPATKTIDANGFITVRPKSIEYVTDESGELVVDSVALYEPTMFYFDSTSVINYEDNEWYLFLSPEKSIVKNYNKEVREGTVFELYTEEGIYKIKQYGLKSENLFTLELFFEVTELPVKQLLGIPTIKGEQILWNSPFLYAVDILDVVDINYNWKQASINSCVFPVKVMYGSPCEFRDSEGYACNDGHIINGEGIKRDCPSCSGIGLKSRVSAIGTLLLNPVTKFDTGEINSTQDPLRYISPEVHTLEFLAKQIESDEMKARAILHLRNKNSSSRTVGDVTATEIFDDSKSMTAFVKPISDQIFDIYDFCLEQIGIQRYGEEFEKPVLTYPKSFDFKTPEDYLKDLSEAINNNLNPAIVEMIILQYVNSYYSDSPTITKVFTLIANADRLFGIAMAEINLQLTKGTVSKWQSILHTSILIFITDAEREDNDFLNKPLQVQIDTVVTRAKKEESEISPVTTTIKDLLPPAP